MKFAFALAAACALAVIPVRSATFNVTVGGPGVLKFVPEFVNAQQGDIILFTFKQKNHTLTQSTLKTPCTRFPEGFNTGFIPVPDSATEFPVARLVVPHTNPIWAYCAQGTHCQAGMVFAINPGNEMEAFKAAAVASGSGGGSGYPPYGASTSGAPPTATTPATTSAAPTTSSAPAPTETPTDHRVLVGASGLVYEPSNIVAKVGDTITFEFRAKNHTITASSFGQPCSPLSSTSTSGEAGFDSGFFPVAAGTTEFPTYTIRVNDTKPIWAYCRQGAHCGQGMVFSANAVEPNTFEAFKTKAASQNGAAPNTSTTPDNAGIVGMGVNHFAGIVVALVACVLGAL